MTLSAVPRFDRSLVSPGHGNILSRRVESFRETMLFDNDGMPCDILLVMAYPKGEYGHASNTGIYSLLGLVERHRPWRNNFNPASL